MPAFPRLFVVPLVLALAPMPFIVPLYGDEPSLPIAAVLPDIAGVAKWDDSNGDTADAFWADDDNLYHFMCDGRGFGTQPRNLNFNKLTGPDLLSLRGELVNSMDEYGKANATEKDGANWKAVGQECIDGVFYGFVARNYYGKHSKDTLLRQTSINASLIKSTDRGLTWTRTARENYETPMWPGPRFGGPAFIHYGRNGGAVTRDKADTFVYVVSNNGFWNGGDDLILARVRRTDLPKLNTSDWQYFTGGDGLSESAWTGQIEKACPMLSLPAKLGWTAPVFIPAMNRYLLVSWYITPTLKAWFAPEKIVYDFFEAPHPWGPWSQVGSMNDQFLGGAHMYGPNLCAKYQEPLAGGAKIQLFTSGCPFQDQPGSPYKMWRFPLLLRTRALPAATEVNDNAPEIKYSDGWIVVAQGNSHDLHQDVHFSRKAGATAEFSFSGTGVEVLTQKYSDSGSIEVFIDGQTRGIVNLQVKNFPRLVQVPVFRVEDLPPGKHQVKVVVVGSGPVALDAFRVLQ